MKALVVGSGVSGRSAYDYLKRHKYEVDFADEKIVNNFYISDNEKDRLFEGLSFIVASPGLSLDLNFFKEAKTRKIKIIGELELGMINIKGRVIALTGTNGKTTTVSLINHILQNQKNKVFLGGNIGVPITSFCDKTDKNSISILECSSYQLETVKKFHSHIAIILNYSVDHLSRHKTLKKYISCKKNISKNQTKDDYLILNYDDELVMKNKPKTKAKILYFSTNTKVEGCFVKRNQIYYFDGKKEEKLLSLKNIKLVGAHNISNVLAACLAVFIETKNKEILKQVFEFQGVEHRIEFVKTINNVAFYNDSKATNIDSTLVAVKSFKNKINLILGGSDKGYGFDELFKNLPKNVVNIAIFGETRGKIAFFAQKNHFINFKICENLKDAMLYCYNKSNPKEIVLLSPACASFDFFLNFEHRGNVFKKYVNELFESVNSCL